MKDTAKESEVPVLLAELWSLPLCVNMIVTTLLKSLGKNETEQRSETR